MLAAMFYAPMDVRLEERPVPLVGSGEVLVQVAAATTCGTDVKCYRRGHPLLFRHPPEGFGHEVAGQIVATGSGVTGFHAGDRVAIANSAPCFQCFYCRRGQYSLCEDLLFLNGAYAEYILIPERIVRHNLYHLLEQTSYIAAALAEPLACALHGIDASAIASDSSVAILGAGPLGLLLTAVAKLWGAYVILTFAVSSGGSKGGRKSNAPTASPNVGTSNGTMPDMSSRLALGKHFGADCVLDVSGLSLQEQCDAIRAQTEGKRGADVIIEAVGRTETWELAVRAVRPGGLVNFFGGCPGGTQVSLETRPIHYSELTLKGVFHHTPAYFAQAVDLINGRHIDVEALITQRVPLSELLHVFECLFQKQGVKYAIIPPAFG
jgi:L-iditol 2-dehydrogenase